MTDDVLVNVYAMDTTKLGQLVKHHSPDDDRIGDCFRTSIACLLGAKRADDVPHFVQESIEAGLSERGGWEDIAAARRWLRKEHDLDMIGIDRAQADALNVPYKVTVRSQSGPWNHCVIARAGEVIWDPAERHTYTMADAFAGEPVFVICEPYDPDPDEQLRIWRDRDMDVVRLLRAVWWGECFP